MRNSILGGFLGSSMAILVLVACGGSGPGATASHLGPVPCFTAAVSDYNVTGTGPIVFDVETLDQGDVYDAATGVFTAPRGGIYHFSFVAHYVGTSGAIQMLKNGTVAIGAVFAGVGSVEDHSTTSSVAVALAAGDTVTVNRVHSGTVLWGITGNGPFTTFSGHLIQ